MKVSWNKSHFPYIFKLKKKKKFERFWNKHDGIIADHDWSVLKSAERPNDWTVSTCWPSLTSGCGQTHFTTALKPHNENRFPSSLIGSFFSRQHHSGDDGSLTSQVISCGDVTEDHVPDTRTHVYCAVSTVPYATNVACVWARRSRLYWNIEQICRTPPPLMWSSKIVIYSKRKTSSRFLKLDKNVSLQRPLLNYWFSISQFHSAVSF